MCQTQQTDPAKAFDCLLHDLLIAKLHAYGSDMSSSRLVRSYLSNRNQRVKINDKFSSEEEIIFGIPQGSIVGPLLFNTFLCDLFLFTITLILQIIEMTIQPMPLKTQRVRLLNGWKNVLLMCLHDLMPPSC